MSYKYVPPHEVISPKQSWQLIAVLDDHGEGRHALALGRWDGKLRLGMRWNGHSQEGKTIGNPQSRGIATWFMLPEEYHEAILGAANLTPDKETLVRSFISKPKG